MIRPPPRSPLFPYTTLFRSWCPPASDSLLSPVLSRRFVAAAGSGTRFVVAPKNLRGYRGLSLDAFGRSEEHTSELQSLRHLVCRLLLEKKKKNKQHNTTATP